jgi:hypothetical protein
VRQTVVRLQPWHRRSLLGLGIFCITVALRGFDIGRAYDVFLDETIYSRISAGAAVDGKLVFGAFPFLLHGPLSFYWQAGVIHLFGISGTAVEVIRHLRWTNAVAAGVINVTLFSLTARVASRRTAAVASGLFALDPFIISYDSRLFLETFASMWVVLGYWLMLPLALGNDARDVRKERRMAYLVGFVFGLALLSKETSAPLYVLPLLWCLVRRWPVSRSVAWRALLAMVATYAPYPIIVCATGQASQLVQQKFGGIERLLGILQETGLNRAGAPSLVSRLTADLHTFLITYSIIGLGSIGVVYLLRKGNRGERFIAVFGAAAFVMLAFQVVQGTLEEQMFYYLVIPSTLVVCCAGNRLLLVTRRPRAARLAITVVLILVAVFDAGTWLEIHLGRDAAIADGVGWIERNVPAGARIAPLADGIQYLLPDYRLLFNPEAGDVSVKQLVRAHTQFVVTSSTQVNQGYSAATPELVSWLRRHARRRFSATGATAGTVVVWQLPGRLPATAPPGPEPLRPRAPISIGAPTYGHIDVASGG